MPSFSSFLAHNSAVPVGRASVAVIAWQFKGQVRVTAIVKAAFAFAEDAPMPRMDPPEIVAHDIHHGKNPMRSVRVPTDLVPYRRRADVLFTGHAYAPPGCAVESINVRLAVANEQRSLVDKTLLIRKPGGFQKLAITYEHAFGGIGCTENPFGEGFSDDEDAEELFIFDPADPKRVAGFGALPQTMTFRRSAPGSSALPAFGPHIVQIPDDFDFDLFQVAPMDQRTDFLRGDETISIEGLHPTLPRVRTRLPGAVCVARIYGLSGSGIPEGKPFAMDMDTLHVSGSEQLCMATWRGTFQVTGEDALASAQIVAGVEHAGEPIIWPAQADLPPLRARSEAEVRGAGGPGGALGASSGTLPISSVPAFQKSGGLPFRPVGSAETLPIPSGGGQQQKPISLPFRPAPGAAPPAPEESPPPAHKEKKGT